MVVRDCASFGLPRHVPRRPAPTGAPQRGPHGVHRGRPVTRLAAVAAGMALDRWWASRRPRCTPSPGSARRWARSSTCCGATTRRRASCTRRSASARRGYRGGGCGAWSATRRGARRDRGVRRWAHARRRGTGGGRAARSGDLPGARRRLASLVGRDTSAGHGRRGACGGRVGGREHDGRRRRAGAVGRLARGTRRAGPPRRQHDGRHGRPPLGPLPALRLGERPARRRRQRRAGHRRRRARRRPPPGRWRAIGRAVAVDARLHPSPNAGVIEGAFAAALGISLGGANRYGDVVEDRGRLGGGRDPVAADIARAVRLRRALGIGPPPCSSWSRVSARCAAGRGGGPSCGWCRAATRRHRPGARSWRRSAPRGRRRSGATRPASARTRRCLAIAWRVVGKCSTSVVAVCGPSWTRRSRTARRVGSARTANSSSSGRRPSGSGLTRGRRAPGRRAAAGARPRRTG